MAMPLVTNFFARSYIGCAARGDVVAGLGGDEFAVLQMPVPEREAAVRLAERLIAEVSVPYCIEGGRLAPTTLSALLSLPSAVTEKLF